MAAAPAPPTDTCNARNRRGSLCGLAAGWGTDHRGIGRCKLHGGKSPDYAAQVVKLEAARLADELDLPPHDALLQSVRLAAGEVAYLTRKVAELDDDQVLVQVTRSRLGQEGGSSYVERTNRSELHAWVRARQDAIDRLARLAKLAIDAGVEERRVRLAEGLYDEIANTLRGVLDGLELTPAQQAKAPDVVRRHLELLEGGKAA